MELLDGKKIATAIQEKL